MAEISTTFFQNLLPELSSRAARATISKLGFSTPPLRAHLLEIFSSRYGEPGCFIGDPVFEATFGWRAATEAMADLSGKLLHEDLVKAMDEPWGDSAADYKFPRTGHPYTHQLESWRTLLDKDPKSVVVTSGTGSGKTECFMVPVLSDLARQRANGEDMTGVRALFLYPLNALIQSQRERLRAWTGSFDGDIRFCLYNGMTPDEVPADRHRQSPNEVQDRSSLRAKPPAILVTNPTMLEYMLVRAQDASILEKSKGKLKWIVLDEAHNYVGSQAAELALLLRRVVYAFGSNPEDIRFVATSATIGSDDDSAKRQLQDFLARLAGVGANQVVVVQGSRAVPFLDVPVTDAARSLAVSDLLAIPTAEQRYAALATNPIARGIRNAFVSGPDGRHYQPLSEIKKLLQQQGQPSDDASALKWLDLLTSAEHGSGRASTAYLPLRLHAFHNTFNGLWACANSQCLHRKGTHLDSPDWRFGMVYMDERRRCLCGAPVFPLLSCNDCNETFLHAEILMRSGVDYLVQPRFDDIDEFSLDRDPEESVEDSSLDSEDGRVDIEALQGVRDDILIVNGQARGHAQFLELSTSELVRKPGETEVLPLRIERVTEVEKRRVLRCPCCEGAEHRDIQFRRPNLGAPFLLGNIIPTLLEFCPDGDAPLALPMRGRKMITFTDSRQGTARIAAQMQQDAERNAVRGAIYRKLISSGSSASPEATQLIGEISMLEQSLRETRLPEGSILHTLLAQKRTELERRSQGTVVSHQDMIQWLSSDHVSDVSRWIYGQYTENDPQFKVSRGKELIAEILVCREFARRPKRQNSLETMGLVAIDYPRLANIKTRRPAVEQAGLQINEWVDFLKICLDFYVRQSLCLDLPSSWERWGGNKVYAKLMLPPSSLERVTSRFVRWPRVAPGVRQNRLVRLLAYALKLDPQSDHGRDRIDALLIAAWEDLTQIGLLRLGQGTGYLLAREDMAFKVIRNAWVCPVTRRLLDVTLRQVTPYLPSKQLHEGVAVCRPFCVPVCDVLTTSFDSNEQLVRTVRNWIEAQPAVHEARLEGLWSSISDRVIEGMPYFRSVEHSAQQEGRRLEHYEAQFKKGHINLMSCSTTMEMGVDIGGVNMVAMNNVPPHPANYLQRAGRAGRRRETRSVALTVCKNNPHDQHVFKNTLWPFTTIIPTPGISLSSPLLVQRHINSMLLAHFLKEQSQRGKLEKLTMEWWMLPQGSSRVEKFEAWCDCFQDASWPDISLGIQRLIRRTVFDGRDSVSSLVSAAGKMFREHAESWRLELEAIDKKRDELSGRSPDDKVPLKALQIQRTRLTAEYLLRELASSGVLPGYGFPTDITTFETMNADSLELARSRDRAESTREDNAYQRRELPSRDTVTALREYAPGASVVIDGLVYESAGITLNWHVPATVADVSEIQNIRRAWRCRHCGASGTQGTASFHLACPECGSALDVGNVKEFLIPAGFSVDLFGKTHNDITYQRYVPVESPWISGDGDWMPLANEQLGRFRATATGSVFHHSGGASGNGYAVCLECGRSAPMGHGDDAHGLPEVFTRPHKRLRGRQGGEDSECSGSHLPFKIKSNVHFGREYVTDVLELALHGKDGASAPDRIVGYTLAVALRRAIAAHLGVNETELGCDTKEVRDEQGRRSRILQLYDIRSAGYSSLVTSALPDLLRRAQGYLRCTHGCDSACQACLLTFDTRFRAQDLDRVRALEFLSDEWLDQLVVPEEERIFGASTKAEFQPLAEAITREVNSSTAKSLTIYLHGRTEEWDLPVSPMKSLLHRLSAKSDITIQAVVVTGDVNQANREVQSWLAGLAEMLSVRLMKGSPPKTSSDGVCLATVERLDGSTFSWGVCGQSYSLPDANWGAIGPRPLLCGESSRPDVHPLQIDEATSVPAGVKVISVTSELDGPGAGFGRRFWSLLELDTPESIVPTGATVVGVRYEDRYLATPMSMGLLLEVVSALKGACDRADCWGEAASIEIRTASIEGTIRTSTWGDRWGSDWPKDEVRAAAAREGFAFAGMSVEIETLPKYQLIHGRRLTVRFSDQSTFVIWLDQGFSYWSIDPKMSRTPANFFSTSVEANEAGRRIAEFAVPVCGHELSTQVFAPVR